MRVYGTLIENEKEINFDFSEKYFSDDQKKILEKILNIKGIIFIEKKIIEENLMQQFELRSENGNFVLLFLSINKFNESIVRTLHTKFENKDTYEIFGDIWPAEICTNDKDKVEKIIKNFIENNQISIEIT